MCWCAPTTQRWSFKSTTKEVCVRAPYTSWRTRSLCGPRTSSSRWEQFIFLGLSIREQTSCRGRVRGTGNGCFTPRWWSRYGEFLARLRLRGPSIASSPVLAGPGMVLGPDFSPQWLSMGDSCQEGSPLTGGGHDPSPRPELWNLWVWPLRGHNS